MLITHHKKNEGYHYHSESDMIVGQNARGQMSCLHGITIEIEHAVVVKLHNLI